MVDLGPATTFYPADPIPVIAYISSRVGWPHGIRQAEKDAIKVRIWQTETKRLPRGAIGLRCRFPATISGGRTVRCLVRLFAENKVDDSTFTVRLTNFFEDGSFYYIRTYGGN